MSDRLSLLKTLSESSLKFKMVFLWRYFSFVALQCVIRAFATMSLMLSPMARFYITENDWLMFLAVSFTCVSYFGLLCFIHKRMIILLLVLHMIIEGFTTAIIVTSFDLMFLLETYILHSFLNSLVLYFACQTRFNFNTWTVFGVVSIFIFPVAIALNIVFGGTDTDGILCVITTAVILLYHSFAISKFINKLCPSDHVLAVVNLQLLPFNYFVFNTLVYRPPGFNESVFELSP